MWRRTSLCSGGGSTPGGAADNAAYCEETLKSSVGEKDEQDNCPSLRGPLTRKGAGGQSMKTTACKHRTSRFWCSRKPTPTRKSLQAVKRLDSTSTGPGISLSPTHTFSLHRTRRCRRCHCLQNGCVSNRVASFRLLPFECGHDTPIELPQSHHYQNFCGR